MNLATPPNRYRLVKLPNGAHCVRSIADAETMHPGIGPAAEAQALYVRQLRLIERMAQQRGEFVIWDVGLGAAANAIAAIRSLRRSRKGDAPGPAQESMGANRVRILSFDHTADALAFALQHAAELDYLTGHENVVTAFLRDRRAQIEDPAVRIEWIFRPGDFVSLLADPLPAPDAIMFDPYSPGKNPAMWTVQLFTGLFQKTDPQRPCALATFTRSTLARTAMLLGGFFVGAGRPSGLKEETTVAANRLELLAEPFDLRWLERARRSRSAEPLRAAAYRQAPLSADTWERLRRHPQFSAGSAGAAGRMG